MITRRRRVRRTPSPRQGAELHYELLFLRHMEKDALVWQTPALAVTAQAFLLTIALDPGSATLARLIVSTLGIVISVMTCQLMAKHRFLRRLDEWKLAELEAELGYPAFSSHRYGADADAFAGQGYLVGRPSFWIWQVGLVLIGLAHLVILVAAVARPTLLG